MIFSHRTSATTAGLAQGIPRDSSGAIFIELLIALSVLIAIVFGAITVNDQINQRRRSTSILRAVSVRAVQDCYRQLADNNPSARACLETVVYTAAEQAEALSPDFSVLVSSYVDNGGDAALSFQFRTSSDASTVASEASRFDATRVEGLFEPLLSESSVITIVEVFERDRHFTLPWRRSFFGSSDILYAFNVF